MLLQVLTSVSLFFATSVSAISADSCALMTPLDYEKVGFNIEFYTVPLHGTVDGIHDQLYNRAHDFPSNDDIISYHPFDPSFDLSIPDSDTEILGQVYPEYSHDITISNFVASFHSVFIPPVTGDYTFSINDVSDGGAMFIYTDRDMYCCEDMVYTEWLNKSSHFYYIPEDPNYQTNSMTVHLDSSLTYMMIFTYVNHGGDAIFKPSVTTPSGEVITNFEGYIYASYSDFECSIGNITSPIVSEWTGTYATTYSTSVYTTEKVGSLGLPYTDVETIYYILTPAPTSSSSIITSSSSEIITSSSSLSEYSSAISSDISSEVSSDVSSAESSIASSIISSDISSEVSSDVSSAESSTVQSSTSSSVLPSVTSSSTFSSDVSTISTGFSEEPSKFPSSIVSSEGNSLTSSFSPSSEATSSAESSISNIDGDSTTKKSTEASTSGAPSSVSSNLNSFSSSFSTKSTPSASISASVTTSSATVSSMEHSGEAGQSKSKIPVSTSTYTDIYGITRTTTVEYCSTSNDLQGTTEVTVTTSTNENGEEFISTITHTIGGNGANQATGISSTTRVDGQKTLTSNGSIESSSISVQVQSRTTPSSASINIQQSPNVADRFTSRWLLTMIPFVASVFFM